MSKWKWGLCWESGAKDAQGSYMKGSLPQYIIGSPSLKLRLMRPASMLFYVQLFWKKSVEGRGGGLVTAGIWTRKRQFRAAPWKKNKRTCSLGAKKIGMTGNPGCFVFLLRLPHSLAAINHVEPQHFRFPRQGPVLGFCLQCSQVLLCEILEKITLKTTFAPVGCEKLQQRLQIQLLNKIIVSQKHPPVGILP